MFIRQIEDKETKRHIDIKIERQKDKQKDRLKDLTIEQKNFQHLLCHLTART